MRLIHAHWSLAGLGLVVLGVCTASGPGAQDAAPTATAAELGRTLFFDPILSRDESVACATCHDPDKGFADDEPLSEGVFGRRTLRNAPTLLNRGTGKSFFWDGRITRLEDQVLAPIQDPREMDLRLEEAVARLTASATYRPAFERVFDGAPTEERLATALAAFVRGIVVDDSPVDRFRAGEREALDQAERSGLWFYESRGRCWRCHSGPHFTDEDFHNTGIGAHDGTPEPGRFAVTGDPNDTGRFKTPSLRGLVHTAPYMHDGSLATLEDVVAFYRRGANANTTLDPHLAPLDMTDADAENLLAFLRALSRE